MYLIVSPVGDEMNQASVEADARGQFFFDGLKAGVYELRGFGYAAGANDEQQIAKQQVVVVDDQVTEITVKLERKPER